MTSEEFLRAAGYRYWRDFAADFPMDCGPLAIHSDLVASHLYGDAPGPLTIEGDRIVARLGDVDGRLYIQYLGFRLSAKVYMVVATHETRDSSADWCHCHFFAVEYWRGGRHFESVPDDHPLVRDAIQQIIPVSQETRLDSFDLCACMPDSGTRRSQRVGGSRRHRNDPCGGAEPRRSSRTAHSVGAL